MEKTRPPLLQTDQVTIQFGGLIAVDKIDLIVNRGEIVCIIGPNGAGKSTFFNLVTGIYRPTHGSVTLEGEDITGQTAHKLVTKGIARTFQTSRLFGDLTVLDNVIIGRHSKTSTGVLRALFRPKKARMELEAAAHTAGKILQSISEELYDQRFSLASTLAQADRRRLEIARALACEPKLILLDEPSSGMDDYDTENLMAEIRKVMQANPDLSFLVIEHDMRLVSALADRVVVMDYGQKIADGNFADIRLMPHVQQAYLGQKATIPQYQNHQVSDAET